MHCGFTVGDWKALYDFVPLFWINTVLLEAVSTAVLSVNENSAIFILKFVTSLVTGLLFDWVPTREFLVALYFFATLVGVWTNWAAVVLAAAQEVLNFAYMCEVLVDNCKFMGLAELMALQFVSNALGSIIRWACSDTGRLTYFFPSCTFILLLINSAVFQDIPRNKRPLFIHRDEKTVIPRPFGVFICFMVLFTAGAHTNLYPMISCFIIPVEILPELMKIVAVPFTYFFVLKYLRYKKISFVLIFFLAAGMGFWLLFLWEYTEWLGLLGITVTSAYCKAAGLVLLSRVLGPYHNGKFFGVAIGIQYTFGCFFISDWWIAFSIGVGVSVLAVACLAPGLKFCEYHRDYAIGMLCPDSPSKNKMNFRITLKRASLIEN